VLDWALGPLGRQFVVAVDESAQFLCAHALELARVARLDLLDVEPPEPRGQDSMTIAL
jgi:hypothetical protein